MAMDDSTEAERLDRREMLLQATVRHLERESAASLRVGAIKGGGGCRGRTD